MSVPTSTAKVQYTLSSTVQALPIPFYFLQNADIKAIRARSGVSDYVMVLGTDYTLTGAGDEAGGTLTTIATNLVVGDKITIKRDIAITQLTNYVYNDKFPAEVHEKVADKLTMALQQLKEVTDRAVQFPESEVAGTGNIMPAASGRAAKLLGFDATGQAVQLYDPISGVFTTGNGIEVSSVAALKAVIVTGLTTGYQASVAGYASASDGGGGLFTYNSASTAADNGGSIIAPNAGTGRWIKEQPDRIIQNQSFVFEGDSLSVDTDLLHYPSVVMAGRYASGKGTAYKLAVSGSTLADLIARYNAGAKTYRPAAVNASQGWLFVWIGANDYATANPSLWLADWKNYLTQARNDGFKIVAFTVMRRNDVSENVDWVRNAMNDGIRAARDYYEIMIDVDTMFDPGNTTGLGYLDGVHLNSAGQKHLGYIVTDALVAGFSDYSANAKQSPLVKQKVIVNGGTTNSGIVVIDTDVEAGVSPSLQPRMTFYRYSGVAGQYFATRFYLSDISTFEIQNAPSAAIGAHVFTARLSITYTGEITLNGALTLSGGLVSYGANDSGGVGYKLVRVPN